MKPSFLRGGKSVYPEAYIPPLKQLSIITPPLSSSSSSIESGSSTTVPGYSVIPIKSANILERGVLAPRCWYLKDDKVVAVNVCILAVRVSACRRTTFWRWCVV